MGQLKSVSIGRGVSESWASCVAGEDGCIEMQVKLGGQENQPADFHIQAMPIVYNPWEISLR